MTLDEYWKNFDLGKEVSIAGSFIYNGIRTFHEMGSLYHEEEVFEFLYFISVGVERLQKIAIILAEHDSITDKEAFEKSLITHSHQELANRLKKARGLDFGSPQNEFLTILSRFYKTHRYGRYVLASVTNREREREALIAFLEKHLSVKIDNESFFVTHNDKRFKAFIGRVLKKICLPLYELIRKEARRLNLYTYKIRYGSKASKIFQFEDFDFIKEDILTKELLLYFVAAKKQGANSELMRESDALPFDPALEGEYIQALSSDEKKLSILEELKHLYEDHISDFKDRQGLLHAFSSEHLSYGDEDEDENCNDIFDEDIPE